MRSGFVVAMSLFFAFPAVGENLTGNDLLSMCDATDEAQLGYCFGYVNGVIEGMKWGISSPLLMSGNTTQEAEKTGSTLLGFCLPPEATLGQYRDVIMLHLRNNPAERHNSARVQVQLALQGAFPCPSE